MLQRLLWIAAAGALGTLARYGISGLGYRWHAGGFPVGTLVVNVLGCLLFGCLWSLAEHRAGVTTETRMIVTVGFLGAFTTFSTFAFETAQFLQEARPAMAVVNLVAQNLAGVLAVFGGAALGDRFFAAG
ncbi:MAG: fluoride efflux transporter CrcB [Planctomycetes bacterium]|nr:fluoride efflux transporter CrcB [Planctomycetota bacterium]MBL7008226.1 fluoride efflux transporter CrcB [Planctomycetota bacterium]